MAAVRIASEVSLTDARRSSGPSWPRLFAAVLAGSLGMAFAACGGGTRNPVQTAMDQEEQAIVQGDGLSGCALLDARAQASVALVDRLGLLAQGQDAAGSCVHGWNKPFAGTAGQRQHFLDANRVTSTSSARDSATASSSTGTTQLVRQDGQWKLDSGEAVPDATRSPLSDLYSAPADCLQSWNDPGNPQHGELQGGSSVAELHKRADGGCELLWNSASALVSYGIDAGSSASAWSATATGPTGSSGGPQGSANAHINSDGTLTPLIIYAQTGGASSDSAATSGATPACKAPDPLKVHVAVRNLTTAGVSCDSAAQAISRGRYRGAPLSFSTPGFSCSDHQTSFESSATTCARGGGRFTFETGG